MALFDFLGGNKKKAEAEQQKIEEQKQEQHDLQVKRQEEEHKDLQWPGIMPINLFVRKPEEKPHLTVVNGSAGKDESETEAAAPETVKPAETSGSEAEAKEAEAEALKFASQIEDPLSAERKAEVGRIIFEPEIKPDMLKDLSLQEVLFLEVALVTANRQKALDNYEQNHQKIRNQFLNLVRAAEKLYVIYDARTGYPLLDGGYAQMYLDEEHANIAARLYDEQLRRTRVIEVPGMSVNAERPDGKIQLKIFDFMFFLGLENVIVDNGWYKGFLRRSEISAPFYINEDPEKIPPYNPALSFALIDYVGEIKWPVNYGKRQEILQGKFNRIMQLVPKSTFIVPLRTEEEGKQAESNETTNDAPANPSDVPANTNAANEKTEDADTATADAQKNNHRVQLPVININGKNMLPVFTDIFEFSKNFGETNFRPIRADFKAVNRFMPNYSGIVINPQGQGMVIERRQAPAAPQGQAPQAPQVPKAQTPAAPQPQAPEKTPAEASDSNVISLNERRNNK
ncbi:SseB family protein [Oribacterium sp. WCC10]|uniref:SseB family protein n=1 Tax=Oribacterium sp. WCC10 TaxID=1855343 RepID=UPI0008DF77D3|nr:SseB family protein [Oribacterium sp. WCC10]SFG49196.1 SseB protein N-terminal domain-containing protein [Oribacterium sp. WCC10]